MPSITVLGHQFFLSGSYSPGQPIGPAEAQVLNSARADHIKINLGPAIVKMINQAGGPLDLTFSDQAAIAKMVEEYSAQYKLKYKMEKDFKISLFEKIIREFVEENYPGISEEEIQTKGLLSNPKFRLLANARLLLIYKNSSLDELL